MIFTSAQGTDFYGSATWIRTRDRPINSRNLYKYIQSFIRGICVKLVIYRQYVTEYLSNLRIKILVDYLIFCFNICSMKLHKIQEALLDAIKVQPNSTVRELGIAISVNSPSHVDYHLKALLAKGLIRKVNKWEIIEQQTRTPVG